MPEYIRILHRVVLFMPYLNLVFLFMMMLYVYITTGRWPTYNMPDPEQIVVLYELYLISLLASIALFFVYPLMLLTFFICKYPYRYKLVLVYFFGIVLMLLPYRNANIANWIAD